MKEIPDPKKYCQLLGMIDIVEGKLAPFPGGIILKSKETGEVLGAIGRCILVCCLLRNSKLCC